MRIQPRRTTPSLPPLFVLAMIGGVTTPLACDGRLEAVPSSPIAEVGTPPPAPTAPPPVTENAAQPAPAPHPSLPVCQPFDGPQHVYTSAVDLESRIAGGWLLCSGKISAAPADARGIEFVDGRATFLVTAGNQLVRSANDNAIRTTSVTALADSYELNLTPPPDAGAGPAAPVMYTSRVSEDGHFLELSTGEETAQFVRANRVTGCYASGPPHDYESVEDVHSRLTGSWRLCGGPPSGGPGDSVGIEVDGETVYFLVWSNGALVRGPGWDYQRRLDLHMLGPKSCQVNLWSGSGQYIFNTRVTESSDYLEMYLIGATLEPSRYVRVQ